MSKETSWKHNILAGKHAGGSIGGGHCQTHPETWFEACLMTTYQGLFCLCI